MKNVKPAAVLILLSFLLFQNILQAQTKNKRPNIVVIISDDHTMQAIDAYGAKYGISPNIDRLAKEGMIFNQSFVTNSLCAPSRAVLLTGKYSHKNGLADNESRFDGAQNQFQKYLQQVGYQTAWVGKWHLETKPQGFDYWKILPGQGDYYNPDFILQDSSKKSYHGYVSDLITDFSIDWLNERDKSKPFCLVVGHKATHRNWEPDIKDLGAADKLDIKIPDNFFDDYQGRVAAQDQDMSIDKTMIMDYDLKMFGSDSVADKDYSIQRMDPEQRKKYLAYYNRIDSDLVAKHLSGKALVEWKYKHYMQDYLSTAISLDRNVGKLLDYLRKNGLMDNTMIIYTSDQGFYLGEHGWFDKRFMYEESMRTPLVIRYPKLIKSGSAMNDMVMNLDLAPTFLDLAGVPVPHDMQGQSILPLLENKVKGTAWRKAMYYHYYEFPGVHNVYRHFGIRTSRYKLIRFYGPKNFWELYDLKDDPHEMHNLYADKNYHERVIELKKELMGLIDKYQDEVARGIVEKERR